MMGMLLWKSPEPGKREKKVVLTERSVLHMRFACAEVIRGRKTPEAVLRRRVLAAAKKLHQAGAVRAVLPAEFPFGRELEKYAIRPVSTLPLRRALAAQTVSWRLERLGVDGGARVAVAGEQLTGELVRTVTELALRYRYVLLDLPYGAEELGRQLRREYGVSLLLSPSAEQLEGAEALVLFGERRDLKRKNPVVLALYEGGGEDMPPLVLPPAMEERLIGGCDRPQLLCALREAGAIRPGQISLGTSKG